MKLPLALVCLVAVTSTAPAQARPRSDSLPRELVTALLGGVMGNRTVEIHAGLADDSLPATLFRDALVLGYSNIGVSQMTVAYFPYTPLATLDTVRTRLTTLGWKSPPVPDTQERGFVSGGGARSSMDALCRGSMVVFPAVSQRTINRTLAVISRQYSREAAEAYCGDRSAQMARMRSPAQNSPLPALPPPPGMHSGGAGTSGSPDTDRTMRMETSLEGDLPVSDITTHYTRLFTSAGWRRTDGAMLSSMSATTFEITDSESVRWHCGLIISVPRRGATDVTLFLRRI